MTQLHKPHILISSLALLVLLPYLSFCGKKLASHDSQASTTRTDTSCASLTTPVTTSTGLALEADESPFFKDAEQRVRDLIPDPKITVTTDTASYLDRGGARHIDFKFSVQGRPLCQYNARLHSLNDKTYIRGVLPDSLSIPDLLPSLLRPESGDMERILASLRKKGTVSQREDSPCLAWDGAQLAAASEVHFLIDQIPYYALITQDKVLKAQGIFFDVTTITETSEIYVKKPTASSTLVLKTFTLSGMSPGNSLCSARFVVNPASTADTAFSTNKAFNFPASDIRFKETSLFTNVTTHADWFLSVGPLTTWPGPKVTIQMDGTNNYLNDSSVYLPAVSTGTVPTIKIGAGDGTNLQNLHIDYDVVSHELGHHVVYQHLTDTTGHSLVVHEAIADTFVFLDTQDPCLGRLICPSGGTLCYNATCLRVGTFPYNFGDSIVREKYAEAHRLSQIISSMLWDIGNGDSSRSITAIGVKDIAKIVLKAVDFFPASFGSSYGGFISDLVQADQSLNNGANCNTIVNAAKSRGLQADLTTSGVTCSQ